MAGYSVLDPSEQIRFLLIVELSVLLGMSPKACCSGTIRRRVLGGLGDLGLDHTNCDLGLCFGDAMLLVVLGLSLAIVVSSCFGAILAV